MKLSWQRVRTVARRELLTTVRRKAFLLTLVGTPAYFGFVMWISTSAESRERSEVLRELSSIGVVDSSGLFAGATTEIRTDLPASPGGTLGARRPTTTVPKAESFRTQVRFYSDQPSAEAALRAKQVSQVLVVPSDYLTSGQIRRYARSSSLFSGADRRAISGWLARNLVRGRVDSLLAARVSRPSENETLFTLNKAGEFEVKDDRREMLDFLLPFAFSMVLGLCIMIGGQYLLQGVAEEKESRILESLLCTVSAEELLAGKLFGLGGVGLLVVGIWIGTGFVLAGPTLAVVQAAVPVSLLLIALGYFLLGYLFFGTLMTGIGAVTNNMREAQQFAVWFSFANFIPFIMITSVLGRPGSPLAVTLSLFPPTAATAMMLRLTAPSSVVPPWQIAVSLLLLGIAAWLALRAVARIFRVGLLMYGKTPTLPEILRWARQG